ncbi:MAG: hypothetical protein QOF55_2491 [Thermoleophilaceae bacterium]|nr:hypothetical protein [Thermoleophilaceae bacterium]
MATLAAVVLCLSLAFATAAQAAITFTTNDAAGANTLAQAMTSTSGLVTSAGFKTVPAGAATSNGTSNAALSFFTNTFAILTSGSAAAADDPNTSGSTTTSHSTTAVRGAYDVVDLTLNLNVPQGANCLTFDFAFYSEEYPEYVGGSFNDAFIAELDATPTTAWSVSGTTISAPKNFAFDSNGNAVSINSSGGAAMSAANAAGTTYDGATRLLSAATQVTPGAHTLDLSIFDAGDSQYDSAVFLDNLTAGFKAVPSTQCKAGAQLVHYKLALAPASASSPVGTSHTVTATLTNTDTGLVVPNASVNFTATGANTAASTAVTNASGQATFTYPGTNVGSDTISANYTDATGNSTSGSAQKTWTKRATQTTVACSPTSPPAGGSTSCTATVSDSDTGLATRPTGTVNISPGGTCTLPAGAGTSASCSVNYTPGAVGTQAVTATYAGDSTHLTSAGSTNVTAVKRTTSTAVACSPSSVPLFTSSDCTVAVTDTDAGTKSTPTGTVTIASSGTCTLSGSGATASCHVAYVPPAVGANSVNATYNGDALHASSSGSTTVTGTKRVTDTQVTCSPATVVLGTSSNCTATVSDSGAGSASAPKPSGTVSFSNGATCTLQGGAATTSNCSVSYTPTAVGTSSITATFPGDAAHLGSSGSANVDATARPTTTGVNCAPSASVDSAAPCTAVVTDTGPGTPSNPGGSVSFSGGPSCILSATAFPGQSSCSTTSLVTAVGPNTVTASYAGDASHGSSSGTTTVTGTTRATSTTVTCSPDSVPVDSSTDCTAKVADTDGGTASTPSGHVSFSDGSGCDLSPAETAGTAACSTTFTASAVGANALSADYSGDPKHGTSSGTTEVTGTKRSTSTAVDCSPASVPVDSSTDCTATVSDTDSGSRSVPGGDVSFSTGGTCTLQPGAGATASCSVSFTPGSVGDHTVTGTYGGDDKHVSSDGSGAVTATKRSTSTAVDCSPASVPVDSASSCTATVSDTDSGSKPVPGGQVDFSGGSSCTLSPTGTAGESSCAADYTPGSVGDHTVTGTYGGDDKHASSDGSGAVTATKRSTSTAVDCSPASVPVDSGTNCTATVSDTDSPAKSAPTGEVDFSNGQNCTLQAGSGASSSCSVGFTPGSVGSHTVGGDYQGDAKHRTSSGSANVTATKRSTSTAVTCAPGSFSADASTQCTATVSDTDSGSKSSPAGTATFSSGSGSFSSGGTCTLSPTATAGESNCAVTYTQHTVGTYTVSAGYGGSAKHSTSSGQTTVSVTPGAPAKLTLTPKTGLKMVGQTHTLTAAVEDAYGNPTPGRPVYFKVTGPGATDGTSNTDSSGKATFSYTSSVSGDDAIRAFVDNDHNKVQAATGEPGDTAAMTWIGRLAGGGSFAIGDANATLGNKVTFWGSQWAGLNSLSGGAAPSSFKGFADVTKSDPPTCGDAWATGSGNSPVPPSSVPAYMAVIVTSKATKSGSTIGGDTKQVVVVKTDAGYAGNPGHAGTGTVIAKLCG